MQTTTETLRCYTNETAATMFVLVVHGDEGDFIGAVCATWMEALEAQDGFDSDLYFDSHEVAPGETLDMDIWS